MSVAIGKKMSASREETFARRSSRDWPSEVHTLDDLKGQVALVTGASRGIGATVAAELDDLGAIVYGGMRRLNAVDGLKPILLDVTQEATVSAAIAQIQHEVGRMDVLVNSAGVGVSDGDLAEVSTAEIRKVLETNLLGAHAGEQVCSPAPTEAAWREDRERFQSRGSCDWWHGR